MKRTKERTNHISLIVVSTLLFIVVLFVCFFLPEITDGAELYDDFSDLTVEEQIALFPESYQEQLWAIHEAYPNYMFEADYLDISFDEAVYQETLYHRKLVNMAYDGVSWRSLDPVNYNAGTGTWNTYSGNWTDAGIDVIEYYMDPRNFLDVQHMYMFAKQTYTGEESRSGVESIIGNSFLSGNYTDSTGTHSYIDTIFQAAAESNVSPYVIAATIRIEQPLRGDSPLIDGSRDGYYNFFNFAASGSDVVGNGIAFAKGQGWNTVYKSIAGGAKLYYEDYLAYGQDTYFYKDFNVINGVFDHQYAQGVYDPESSAVFLKNALGKDAGASLVLRIPVYSSMWAEPPAYPPKTGELNSRYLIGATQTGWVKDGNYWYYIDSSGTKKRGWIKDGGSWYYMNSAGVMQTGWVLVNGLWYYLDSSGAMQTGWLQEGKNAYYLSDSGAMQTGWAEIGGEKYYMNSSGAMQTGWQKIGGFRYYLDKNTGILNTGWFEEEGQRYYLEPSSGAMKTGWVKDDGKWYYLNADGQMMKGWITVNGNRYYLEESGMMQTGWFEYDEDRYYLDPSGIMHRGWLNDAGSWYYFDENGIMQTGWIRPSGTWYFLKPSGVMAENEWYSGYWLGEGGAWTYQPLGSWRQDSAGWWFGDTSGWYARNEKLRINGTEYSFNASGYLAE